jgi:uncharacterized protein (TIGR00299 family) protein
MKILYFDCFSGISGDMNLGAMIDLGVDFDYLLNELKKLSISGYEIKVQKAIKKGIEGTKLEVKLTHQPETLTPIRNFVNIKIASKEESGSVLEQTHQHERTYNHIKQLIVNSELSAKVKEISLDIFRRIAEAEAKIHGKGIEEVHFHEVGALDSIVDIVGAAICIDFIKPDKIISAPPQLGGGFVKCAHGNFPVPAPATAEILKGIPVKTGAVNSETTTPTGAAILASLCTSFSDKIELIPQKIAYGIGHKDFDIPNVLRVILAEENIQESDLLTEKSKLIECNIDDMSTESFGYILEKLFETGADDVFFEPIVMKKNRPAQKLSVLIRPDLLNNILSIIFAETTTLGVRILNCEKKMLARRSEIIETRWGPVKIKYGMLNGEDIKAKPEYDDCVKIAKLHNLSFQYVYNEIIKIL